MVSLEQALKTSLQATDKQNAEQIYSQWVYRFCKIIGIADQFRDEEILSYIKVAHKNIFTQYFEIDLKDGEIDPSHPWAFDEKTMLATIHLAISYFSNPDIAYQSQNVVDMRMIYRILGDRVKYNA